MQFQLHRSFKVVLFHCIYTQGSSMRKQSIELFEIRNFKQKNKMRIRDAACFKMNKKKCIIKPADSSIRHNHN